MKIDHPSKPPVKETYNKPVLRSFSLLAKEVMGDSCKTTTTSAVGQAIPPCASPAGAPCSANGS